jgi:hypothetical protein
LDARREESFRGFLRTQLGDDIAMHLGTLAIDGALQLQTRAMIWRKLCGNHLTVMRSIVPRFASSSINDSNSLTWSSNGGLPGWCQKSWRVYHQFLWSRCSTQNRAVYTLPASKNWSTLLVFPARPLAGTGSRGFLVREAALTRQRHPRSSHTRRVTIISQRRLTRPTKRFGQTDNFLSGETYELTA